MGAGCGLSARRGAARPSPSACRLRREVMMASEANGASEAKAVLVVEDDPDMRDLVGVILAEEGYRVLMAPDGQAALEQVAQELPGVILLDMKMPRMNGWEFARQFRRRYNRHDPVALV